MVLTAEEKLAEVGVETARTAKTFGIDPKVAFLSYSTKGDVYKRQDCSQYNQKTQRAFCRAGTIELKRRKEARAQDCIIQQNG